MPHCDSLWVAVNLSAFQLPNSQSLAAIQRILADSAVQADKVVLEVTETALAIGIDGGIASLNTLKGFGVRIAIDDFRHRLLIPQHSGRPARRHPQDRPLLRLRSSLCHAIRAHAGKASSGWPTNSPSP